MPSAISVDESGFFFSLVRLRDDSPYRVYVHEIGHTLGLKHPFETTNERANFPLDENLEEGQGSERSIMSYSDIPNSLQPADIAALQFLYGAPGTDFDGLQSKLEDIGITPEII